jgi:proline iminopeptidase
MDKSPEQNSAGAPLYPPIEPFDRRMLDVGDGHCIYVEQSGHPAGLPVVVLHGGPGGGCSPMMRRFFDPRITGRSCLISAGCGRSKPNASVEDNTTRT